MNETFRKRRRISISRSTLLAHASFVAVASAAAAPAQAFNIETDNPDFKARWDTTIGYSLGFRTEKPSATLTEGADALNFNDGDLNFAKRKRPITNRFDLFTEADASYRGYGGRISAAAWYDFAYEGGTSNSNTLAPFPPPAPFTPGATLNNGSQGEFTGAARGLHGHKAEVLDAFVFGKVDLGAMPLNLRLGKHALLWGESLFFGANAIAGGMAPIDIIKAQSSPNATFKEIVRPVWQLSGQLQATPNVSVGAYYQFDWEKSRLPAAGSYYSTNDTIDVGGERLYFGNTVTTPGGPLTVIVPLPRAQDGKAPNSGQGGLDTHIRLPDSDLDIGLYAIQYHSKLPVAYLNPFAGALPNYNLVYPEKVRAYGTSLNTTVFDNVNLGFEASLRTNTPLTKGLVVLPGPGPFDANNNPAYPVGRSAHVNFSTIATLPPWFAARESNVVAEVMWNRVLSCQKNCVNIPPGPTLPGGFAPRDGNADRDSWGLRFVYTPVYRQVVPSVDLSVPVGLSYSPKGKSGVLGPFLVDHGGDMSFGLSANVRETFTVSLNYTHYYGAAKTQNNAAGDFTFGQSLADRDNITFSARVSF